MNLALQLLNVSATLRAQRDTSGSNSERLELWCRCESSDATITDDSHDLVGEMGLTAESSDDSWGHTNIGSGRA